MMRKPFPEFNEEARFPGTTAHLQQQLYDMGAFPEGTSYKKAVDNKMGSMTKAAIRKAEKMGYDYHPEDKSFTLNPTKKLQRDLLDLGFYGENATDKEIDGKIGAKTNKAISKAEDKGYRINRDTMELEYHEDLALKEYPYKTYQELYEALRSGKARDVDGLIMNQYPFGYAKTKKYNPDDYKDEPLKVQAFLKALYATPGNTIKIGDKEMPKNVAKKIFSGVMGVSDPGVQATYEFANLDWNQPGAQQKADSLFNVMNIEEPTWGIKRATPKTQKEIQGRIDENLLHLGYGQMFNSYMINPDFTAKGMQQTYVHTDPKVRKAEQNYAKNVVSHDWIKPDITESNPDKLQYHIAGDPYLQHGNYTVISDTAKNQSNTVYTDVWDFGAGDWITTNNLPGTRTVSVGDYAIPTDQLSEEDRKKRLEFEKQKKEQYEKDKYKPTKEKVIKGALTGIQHLHKVLTPRLRIKSLIEAIEEELEEKKKKESKDKK